jgi:hypothetical protein
MAFFFGSNVVVTKTVYARYAYNATQEALDPALGWIVRANACMSGFTQSDEGAVGKIHLYAIVKRHY